uniref:Uncharacterized protein n=1 Tax=Arion vulgaris TaxID=1028688 RepID=A0A0B7AI12_9EUPU
MDTTEHKEIKLDDQTNKVTDSKASCITAVSKTHAHEMNIHLTNNVGIDKAANNNYRDSVPDAPSGRPLVSAKEKDSAYLSWCEPEHCKESDVTHYIIEAKIGEEKTWDVVVLNCQELSCHIQGLKPSTAYQFRILAANTHGVSSPSEPSETFNTPEPLILTSDYKHENELHLATRLVTVNTSDKFEDLYDVEKEVGKGKFGVVYKCKHKSDGTVWAAKVVRCRAKEKIALKREIDIMNRLRHPKILLLWDAFESPRQMVLVMEFVGAGELFERVVADDFVLTENDCIHFMQQICEGVNYMHLKNILHLDLKPENILCIAEDSNRIKIIDFGLAQFHKDGQSTKVLFGTPEFIAPEVINYDEIGFVTDMWSVGVICYVLLSGLSPFLGDSDSETLSNVTIGEYDFDDEVFEEISNLAKDFISSLLVKKKEKRLLTKQCLEHPWLSQDDIDGAPRKRLSTERLKKFMIRRKWLKTGNAVKAVSRLLKSNSLSGFGIFNHSIGNDNMLDTPSPSIQTQDSILQMTTEAVLDEVDQDEPNFNEDCILPDISTNVGNFSQDITEESFSSSVSNQTYSSKVESPTKSIWTSTEDKEIVTHSSEKITDSAAGVISKEEMASSNRDEAASNSASRFISSKSTDLNSTSKTASALSSSPIPTSSRLSNDVLSSSTSENKVSPHVNKTVNDVNQVPRVSDEKALHQAPYFTKTMIKCKTCTGDVARFEVTVSGNPLPHVTWFFEDEEIQSDSRHILRSNKNATTFSLTIRNIEEDDDGEYTCKAINSQGESTCAAYLSVLQV